MESKKAKKAKRKSPPDFKKGREKALEAHVAAQAMAKGSTPDHIRAMINWFRS